MPDIVTPTTNIGKAKIATGAGIAAALAIAIPVVSKWEGTKTVPYRDVVGVWTVCTGETRVEMRRYTPEQCAAMLKSRLGRDYIDPVAKCVPQIAEKPPMLAAMGSLAYNIGAKAACNSTDRKSVV